MRALATKHHRDSVPSGTRYAISHIDEYSFPALRTEIVKLRAHRTPLRSPRPQTILTSAGGPSRYRGPSDRPLPTPHVASRSASRQHDKDNDPRMTHHRLRSKPVDRRAQTQHIPPAWASVSIVTSVKIAAANFLNRRYASVVHSQQPSSHRARLPHTARLEAGNCSAVV